VGRLALVQPRAFDQAHDFYERYGGITIVLARFMPFIRTFAPFVAGVAEMGRTKFTAYNVGGALLWVLGIARQATSLATCRG
jgi:membrane-associated protein